MIKNLPSNAGDTDLITGLGRSHMWWSNLACASQLLKLCSKAREPQLLSPHAAATETRVSYSPCSTTREATAMRNLSTAAKSSPWSLQLEKARVKMKTQHSPK